MSIVHLVASNDAILMVYATYDSLHSFQILFWDGLLYHPQELYPYSFTALKVAEERINHLRGYLD